MSLTVVSVVSARRLLTFAGVKSGKKEGLPGQHKDSQVSNTSWASIFTMRCSVAVKTVHGINIVDQRALTASWLTFSQSLVLPSLQYSKKCTSAQRSYSYCCMVSLPVHTTTRRKHAGSYNDARARVARKTSATSMGLR